jgi:hypothetical protein
VFVVYNKVGDSGDVVIEKQGFSIVDTHEPAFAKPLSPMDPHRHRNQIFPVGRHQEVRRFGSPGLHHTTPVSSHCEMSRNNHETHTRILFRSFLPSPATTTLCYQQASGTGFH